MNIKTRHFKKIIKCLFKCGLKVGVLMKTFFMFLKILIVSLLVISTCITAIAIKQKKNEVLLKHEEELKRNISFYGNGVLLNTFDYIKDEFLDDKFNINKDYTYEVLKEDIKKEIDNNTLNYNILLVFDKTFEISIEEYIELITLGSNYNIYIVSLQYCLIF